MGDSKFTPAIEGTQENFLYFQGRWGDEQRPKNAEGQEDFHGFLKWTGGPQGPLFKHLDRPDVCWPQEGECVINSSVRKR